MTLIGVVLFKPRFRGLLLSLRFVGIHEPTLSDTPALITGIRNYTVTVIDCIGRDIPTNLFLKMLRNIGLITIPLSN